MKLHTQKHEGRGSLATLQKFLSGRLVEILVGAICIIFTSLSVLRADFFRPHDFTHAARIVEMQRSLSSGEFPVRWSQYFGFGYGMPLFNFYAPLPYYIAQIVVPFIGVIGSIKFLYVLNSVLAFVGMYLWSRELWGRWGGVVSAVLFSFATYRALDLYVRGAVGEVFAMVLIPFVLYGTLLLRTHRLRGTLWTSIALASVLLSHNLLGMLSVPLTFFFGIGMLVGGEKFEWKYIRSSIQWLCASIVLALGLSAFYIFPAFLEKEFTRVQQTITVGYFDFHNHFVYIRQLFKGTWGYGGSIPGVEDGMSFALGIFPIILLFASFYILLQAASWKHRRAFVCLLLFLFGSVFLTLGHSKIIWENIAVFSYIQFPWRFLTFVHIFLAAAGGAGMVIFERKKTSWIACILVASICVGVMAQSRYFVPEAFTTSLSQYYATDPDSIQEALSTTLNDYIPPAIVDEEYPMPPSTRLDMVKGRGEVALTKNAPAKLEATVACMDHCDLRLNIFQFPGWRIYIDGNEAVAKTPDDLPIYEISVDEGTHEFVAIFTNTPVRNIGNVSSLVSGVLIAGLVVVHKKEVK